jgi:hypothetical protein
MTGVQRFFKYAVKQDITVNQNENQRKKGLRLC